VVAFEIKAAIFDQEKEKAQGDKESSNFALFSVMTPAQNYSNDEPSRMNDAEEHQIQQRI
jgi:hypothetical protein